MNTFFWRRVGEKPTDTKAPISRVVDHFSPSLSYPERFISSMDSAISLMASNSFLSTLSSTSVSTISTLSFPRRAALPPIHRRQKFISIFASGNGNGGVRGESGGGGGGGDDGGPKGSDVDSKLLAGEADDDATLSADVIVLGVEVRDEFFMFSVFDWC